MEVIYIVSCILNSIGLFILVFSLRRQERSEAEKNEIRPYFARLSAQIAALDATIYGKRKAPAGYVRVVAEQLDSVPE